MLESKIKLFSSWRHLSSTPLLEPLNILGIRVERAEAMCFIQQKVTVHA